MNTRNLIIVSKDVAGYLPTIDAPATELSTVYEIMNQSNLMMEQLHLERIVVVMDQALYAKTTEIAWKHREKYARIVLRMGTFLSIMTLLAIIGKRFQDGGLRDLCIESGIVAEGSVSGVLDGKMYNRAVRTHKYIYEALMRLVWKGFIPWTEANLQHQLDSVTALLNKVSDRHNNMSQEKLQELLNSEELTNSFIAWNHYLDHLRNANGNLSSFWMSYIDMVGDILLGLLRASREGNWQLHLCAIRKLIPWCFAYDRLNYARYLPAYFAQMTNLQTDHPQVYEHFANGGFSVQLAADNPFARILVDQTTEVTVNKDTQTVGGTTKFSQKRGAVKRFYLTAKYRYCVARRLKMHV